jgi:hypothetical protein
MVMSAMSHSFSLNANMNGSELCFFMYKWDQMIFNIYFFDHLIRNDQEMTEKWLREMT